MEACERRIGGAALHALGARGEGRREGSRLLAVTEPCEIDASEVLTLTRELRERGHWRQHLRRTNQLPDGPAQIDGCRRRSRLVCVAARLDELTVQAEMHRLWEVGQPLELL